MMALETGCGAPFTAAQVAAAVDGELMSGRPGTEARGVGTDSRLPLDHQLFVALKGENFDGSRFCVAAQKAGASILLVEQAAFDAGACAGLSPEVALVVAADSLRALGDLAAWHRRRFPVRLAAVTGSNGKTTTKEMVAAVLGGAPGVLFNRGNFNNLIGMPRALLGLSESHHHAVMEMGMNAPGEIARLAEIAGPRLGLITNVHPVHLAGLGSLQAVAQAKGELLAGLPGEGVAILNADDPMVLGQAERTRARVVTFGHNPMATVKIDRLRVGADGLRFALIMEGQTIEIALGRLGGHNAMNAAAAAAVGLVEEIEPELIAQRLADAPAPPMRMEILPLGEFNLVVDCYNANPRSVQAALAAMGELPADAPRLAILGDMLELGDAAEQLHHQTGLSAAESGLSGLCAFGELSAATAAGARSGGLEDVEHTTSIDGALEWARARLAPGAWLLLKGSRGMRLERVARALAAEHGIDWVEGH